MLAGRGVVLEVGNKTRQSETKTNCLQIIYRASQTKVSKLSDIAPH